MNKSVKVKTIIMVIGLLLTINGLVNLGGFLERKERTRKAYNRGNAQIVDTRMKAAQYNKLTNNQRIAFKAKEILNNY